MSPDSNFLLFVLGVMLVLLTPGPTNTLLMGAGVERGRNGVSTLIGAELAGYLLTISAWGLFLIPAQRHYPWIIVAVRAGASGYLAWMAIKVWRAAGTPAGMVRRTITPGSLFAATLMNPKGLLFASTIFPAHAFDNLEMYAIAMAGFSCMLVPIAVGWVSFGMALSSGRLSFINPVKLQRTIALTVGLFSMSIAWTVFR